MPKLEERKLTPRQQRLWSEHKQKHHSSAQTATELFDNINSIESLYKALGASDDIKTKALLMLRLRSWLTAVSVFDPVTGHALSTGIVDFMDVVAQTTQDIAFEGETNDRIYRIATHTGEAIQAILEHTRDKILREYAMLPIYAVREIDSTSVQWLSRKPGRTIREKLAGKPYIKAVRRRSSVDTAENRLFKAFLLRFEQILLDRQSALNTASGETCEALLVSLQRWLRGDDAAAIGYWDNLPPNNTLLQDKHYKKVWGGWLWLQDLDAKINEDNKRTTQDFLSVIYWKTLALLNQTGCFRIAQQPVKLDYDCFAISLPLPITKGYLFPKRRDTQICGKITHLVTEKRHGFIGRYFFYTSDLSTDLCFDELKVGQLLLFNGEELPENKWRAKRIMPPTPKSLELKLSDKGIDIRLDQKELSVRSVIGREVVLIQKPKGTKKKFPLNLPALKEVPEAILSLLTDASFTITDKQSDLTQMDVSIVDLCSIRPMFTNSSGSQTLLPFKLLQQKWKVGDEEYFIDCAESKAIAFGSAIETVSMKSLFLHNSTLPDAAKSSASMFFVKKLRDYIPTNNLSYLVPDWGNDFDLECVRKSVSFYFEKSTPLPKSIAIIFAWQSSQRFKRDDVCNNAFVLVVDAFDGGISITPVQAKNQKKLNKILPESKGISWERHPTFTVKDKDIYTKMDKRLSQAGCQPSNELIELFGFDGLVSDAGTLSFVNNDDWYHLPADIKSTLLMETRPVLREEDIKQCITSLNQSIPKGAKVFVLPVGDSIQYNRGKSLDYCFIADEFSFVEGGKTLNSWQKKATDIDLWRDHLPKLSIRISHDGRLENFYLVKDATVTPQRGIVPIPVDELFTLPAGQPDYNFPLQQGEEDRELQFAAYLKSSAFPLQKDTRCRLKMTYTYGANDPYELKFIPSDASCTEFKSIRVEWRRSSVAENATIDFANLVFPDFPASKTWSDFQQFPNNRGRGEPTNLLDNITREIAWLDSIYKYGRVKAEITSDWEEDKNGGFFCFADDIFFHRSRFDLLEKQDLPKKGDFVSFYKIKTELRFKGHNITLNNDRHRRFFSSKFYFSLYTIWDNGHSLSETDVPGQFRNAVLVGTELACSIIESENIPSALKKELRFFLSCLHKDSPSIVSNWLVKVMKEVKMEKNEKGVHLLLENKRSIAFAIGDAELPWQRELLANAINLDNKGLIQSIAMEILSIALWRSEGLISKLTESELSALNSNLRNCIKFDLDLIKVKKHRAAILCKHLELLLALLRTRESEEKKIKMILAPNKKLTEDYVDLVDAASKMKDIELKSRISLHVEKPKTFYNTPDFLYALRMYLTGDSGANTIIIEKISSEYIQE